MNKFYNLGIRGYLGSEQKGSYQSVPGCRRSQRQGLISQTHLTFTLQSLYMVLAIAFVTSGLFIAIKSVSFTDYRTSYVWALGELDLHESFQEKLVFLRLTTNAQLI